MQGTGRRALGQQLDRQPRQLQALLDHRELAVVGDLADHRGVQVPLLEDPADLFLATRLDHDQHPLLGLGEHHLVGGHTSLTPGNAADVHPGSPARARRALRDRAGEPGRAQVLEGHHAVQVPDLHAGFQQALLQEGVADLDGGPPLLRGRVELQ